MSGVSQDASASHRMRSVLMRLRLEIALSASLSENDAQRLLDTVDELAALDPIIRSGPSQALDVVVIEDDIELGDLIVRGLCREGHRATRAANVHAAEQVASDASVVVLDLSVLADASAADIQWLREHRPVILTGAAPARTREMAAIVNARAVLMKPISTAALADALAQVSEATRG